MAKPWQSRPIRGKCLSLSTRQEGQPFEHLHILFVLQQRPVQTRQAGFAVALQVFGGQILGQKQFQPVQHFRGRGLFLQPRCVADFKELRQRGGQQRLFDRRVVQAHDGGQRGGGGGGGRGGETTGEGGEKVGGGGKGIEGKKRRRRRASGSSFSLFEVMMTTGRCRARMVSPVS